MLVVPFKADKIPATEMNSVVLYLEISPFTFTMSAAECELKHHSYGREC